MNENKSLDQLLKEAEINRVNAETTKIELENRELRWSIGKLLFKAFIFSIISVPIIWFYVEKIALPIHNRDNIELEWKISVAQDSLNKAIKIHKKDVLTLLQEKTTQKNEYILDLQEILYEKSMLDSAYKVLSDDYKNLSNTLTLTEKERERFRNEFTNLESNFKSKANRISELNQKIELAKQKGGHNLIAVSLAGSPIRFRGNTEIKGGTVIISTEIEVVSPLSWFSISKEDLYSWFETSKGIIYLHEDDLKEIKKTSVDSERSPFE